MKKKLFIASAMVLVMVSCVSKKKLVSEQNRMKLLQSDSTSAHAKLNDCTSKLSDCNSKLSESNTKLNDYNALVASLEKQKKTIESNAENEKAKSTMTIAEQAKRLKDLEDMIQAQKNVMNKLKKTVADALVNFKPDELTVSIKDGKVYVSLQEKLLFKSGSDAVDPKGKEALKSLAVALNGAPDINIEIEGHTDSIAIKGKFDDNWALSAARATSIVRILTHDYKVDPYHITASGRSKFYPVADNKTAEGRAKNRRTEIILSPNLSELMKLINQ